jgi:hypothetical protein
VKAAETAAQDMGKAVRATVDDFENLQYMWVLFIDRELSLGEPCPCGSADLLRSHPGYVTCAACEVTHALMAGDSTSGPVDSLAAYADVRWLKVRRAPDGATERRFGRALDQNGNRVLLIATYRLSDGEPIPDLASPEGSAQRVRSFPIEGFRSILDLGPLEK